MIDPIIRYKHEIPEFVFCFYWMSQTTLQNHQGIDLEYPSKLSLSAISIS